MKIILQDGSSHILRFDKGEEVMSGLVKYAKDNNITGATFYGIGAGTPELGFFNEFLKDYRRKPFLDVFEITSLAGNIAMSNGEPVFHAHGSFANSDFNVIGGHIFKITVTATCEIFLTKLDGELKRELDPGLNLNLLA